MGYGSRHGQRAAYACAALADSDAEQFEAHLATCPFCLADVADRTGVTDALADIDPHQPAPPDGLARLRAAIAAHQECGAPTR